MSTVLNIAQLFLLFGLGFFYFAGLGWLVMELVLFGNPSDNRGNIALIRKIPLAIVLGFIVNYGLSLMFQSLSMGLRLEVMISSVGIWRFVVHHHRTGKYDIETSSTWLGTIFICLLYLVPILFNPLFDWDARSIWFFHAKMIFSAGSFGLSAGWQHPSVVFSHTDYPNLVPGIAAQTAHILGYWNEYAPKLSLVFVLVPAVMWLFTFADRSFSFVVLILIFPFSLFFWIWNGYIDAHLSLYLSVAMLLLGRYMQYTKSIDLISAIACLALLPYLKNEGQLAMPIGIFSIVLMGRLNKIFRSAELNISSWRGLAFIAILLLPFVLWSVYKLSFGLSSDLNIGTSQSIMLIVQRINDGAYYLILDQTYKHVEGALLLLGLLFFAVIAQSYPIPKTIVPSLATAIIYYTGLFAIYIQTPNDLNWHLSTSADRTMLSIAGCVFVACYFLLNALEAPTGKNAD